MGPVRILVAEDDVHLGNGLVDMLEGEGYEVALARDGEEALTLFRSRPFDLVLLDIMMPGRSGYDVCRAVREASSDVSVIMLTAKGEEIDKVVGLQLGADDYVTKPFGIHELLARIQAVLRRSRRSASAAKSPGPGRSSADSGEPFSFGDAVIDPRRFRARLGERAFSLTAREMKLVELFMAHPGEVLTRDRLLDDAWGIDYSGTTRTLDQHIAQLRKKIEASPRRPRTIVTVHGLGYRYEKGE